MPKKITKESVSAPFEKMFEASFQGMTPKQPEETGAADPVKDKPKKTTRRKTTRRKTTKKEAPEEKSKASPYSIWIHPEDRERLKVYCDVTKKTKTDVITEALNEYYRKHKPTAKQLEDYQNKLKDITG